MNTIYGELVAKEHDLGGYTIYVFKNLDPDAPFGCKFYMVTRWPNWQHSNIDIGEIGYVTYKEVIAGQDTWWDGTKFVPYNYTNIVFIKFVRKKSDTSQKDIIL